MSLNYYVVTILTATKQPLSRQIYEWEQVIRSYRFVRIIDLECNFLAGEYQNSSGRLAITISLSEHRLPDCPVI
jgi:hypothetical protein